MDTQNVVYPYNGILFSYKKKCNIDTCYNVNEPGKHYAKSEKPDTKKSHMVWFHLYKMFRTGKSIERES